MITEEVVILEFQGDFEHSDMGQFDSLTLGQLKETSKGNYDLVIGNHLLRGKMSDLPKPIIMTEKLVDKESGSFFHQVRAVIKRKVTFSGRPTPLRLNQQQALLEGAPASKLRIV